MNRSFIIVGEQQCCMNLYCASALSGDKTRKMQYISKYSRYSRRVSMLATYSVLWRRTT